MKHYEKSPHELIPLFTARKPHFNSTYYSESERLEAEKNAISLQDEMIKYYSENHSDQELSEKILELRHRAIEDGIFDPLQGKGSEKRIQDAIEFHQIFKPDAEQARAAAIKDLGSSGLLALMRNERKSFDNDFNVPIENYIKSHEINSYHEQLEFEKLLKNSIEISTITSQEREELAENFTSGNFLYHGAKTKQIIEILDSGRLLNAIAINKETGRGDKDGENSGYEGISWSMNEIDALPGDRFHLAGFIAAPETILDEKYQLSIPSRPAPFEVIQVPSKLDSNEYFKAKTEDELYNNFHPMGEINSVKGNIISLLTWKNNNENTSQKKPLLLIAKEKLLQDPNHTKTLRSLYEIKDDLIGLKSELLQQTANEIPTFLVWLQAAIDTGRLSSTSFDKLSINEIVDKIDSDTFREIAPIIGRETNAFAEKLNKLNANEEVGVPVEKLHLVIPKKDFKKWMQMIARAHHKPKGILIYDDKDIKLENFMSNHKGDNEKLTNTLREIIPKSDNFIDYSQILGNRFSNEMRVGIKNHVISEKYLNNRKVIKKIDDQLVVT